MKQQCAFLLILLFHIHLSYGNRHEKCCKIGEHVVEKNSSFVCEDNPNKRLQNNLKNTDFFNRDVIGTCIDVFSQDKTAIFSVADIATQNISKKEDVDVRYFPKCCPLGHQYNKTLHSCVEKEDSNDLKHLVSNDSFIKIGLPKCKIIFDEILNSTDDMIRNDYEITILKTKRMVPSDQYCVDSTLDGKFVVRICEEDYQICGQMRCIHKCCPDGQSFVNGSNCYDTFRYGVDLHSSSTIRDPDAPFALIHGFRKPVYILREDKYSFFIDRFGLFVSYMNQTKSFEYFTITNDSYCIDYAYKKGKVDKYTTFATKTEPILETKFVVTRWVKIISCVFLVLTISVYLLLPKMRNLFGKILVNYCVATFFFFFLLSISQFYSSDFGDTTCTTIGFFNILASICSFTWLQIMCVDIWFSFGTPRTLTGPLQKNEWKRLLQYSLYGWGFPVVWVLLIFLISVTNVVPDVIYPYIGDNKCYMQNFNSKPGNYAYILYLTMPVLIQQVINSILFFETIQYCLKIKREIAKMNDARRQTDLNAGKERLGLIMKLAVVMGVSFFFETVSTMYDFKETVVTTWIEVIWDTINCSQGLFIFIIFICKKKVYDNICEKIPILKSRKSSVSSTNTTQVSLHRIGREKTP